MGLALRMHSENAYNQEKSYFWLNRPPPIARSPPGVIAMSARPVRLIRPLVAAVATFALLASAGSTRADTVSFAGSRGGTDPVSFSGTLEVTAPGAGTSAALKITLSNTTSTGDAVNYGFITGFGFNVPSVNITGATGSSSDTDFKFLNAASHSTSLQGGEFDYAFSTSSTQLHTVSSSQIPLGLAAGQSATFLVNLTGTGLSGLTAAQIIQELSAPTAVPFSVRFRSTNTYKYQGKDGPDGDKVPVSSVNYPPNNAVPAPPGVVLAGVGFGCLLLGRIRLRRNATPKV